MHVIFALRDTGVDVILWAGGRGWTSCAVLRSRILLGVLAGLVESDACQAALSTASA